MRQSCHVLKKVTVRLHLQAAVFLVTVVMGLGLASAASLQVAPTSLTLQATQNAEGLWLSNSGEQPVQVQLRVFRWTQVNGVESLDPTRDLVVSPPMQTLPPGERQLVRVIRTTPVPPTAELSYRVIVDELPTDTTSTSPQGLRFVLRYSIPIFVVPQARAAGEARPEPAAIAPSLQVRLVAGDDGEAILEVRNSGRQHAQIADLAFGTSAADAVPLLPGLLGYTLAGQTMRWPLNAPASRFDSGVFTARINSEPEPQQLQFAPAAR